MSWQPVALGDAVHVYTVVATWNPTTGRWDYWARGFRLPLQGATPEVALALYLRSIPEPHQLPEYARPPRAPYQRSWIYAWGSRGAVGCWSLVRFGGNFQS